MKAIMMSIKPEWIAKILNGIKTLEIRRKFPIDYVGWVYIYCTKDQNEELWWYDGTEDFRLYKKGIANEKDIGWHLQNGKVIARFWCDKVEEIKRIYLSWNDKIFAWETETFAEGEIENKACLSNKELRNYLAFKQIGYAIHITKLEIFNKPKELNEFKTKLHIKGGCKNCPQNTGFSMPYCKTCDFLLPLNRAPQSWCYIEI